MKYTIIPPQEIPRGLTAYSPPENLLAHELGFYATNYKRPTKAKVHKVPEVKVVALAPVVPVPVLVTEVILKPFSLSVALKNAYKHFEEIGAMVTRPVNADFDGDAIGVLPMLKSFSIDEEESMPVTAFFQSQTNRSVGEAEMRLYRQY